LALPAWTEAIYGFSFFEDVRDGTDRFSDLTHLERFLWHLLIEVQKVLLIFLFGDLEEGNARDW
jgi:hypothetical protein